MDNVLECFHSFIKDRLELYRLGKNFYPDGAHLGDQHSQNPYIKTEADIQIKFGGFLECWLKDRNPYLVVHAEMPIYPHRGRADLTIHSLTHNKFWTSRQIIDESLDSVIEIKFANVRQPLYDFEHGGIDKDLNLLKSLRPGIKRYHLLIDEAEAIDPVQGAVREFLTEAKLNKIKVLSNNTKLMA